jgi:hypothetical protein
MNDFMNNVETLDKTFDLMENLITDTKYIHL